MRGKAKYLVLMAALAFLCISHFFINQVNGRDIRSVRVIITSDTILASMVTSLLPPNRYSIEAILPPGQCPGHYDVKLSDIKKLEKADLIISFGGMPFMGKVQSERSFGGQHLLVHTEGRNWMVPHSYRSGLGFLAEKLIKHFPEDRGDILSRKERAEEEVKKEADSLLEKVKQAKISGNSAITSSMQKEFLEWMGVRIVGEYGRQESMSAKDLIRLVRIGRDERILMVVDNLQSGPEVGKSIAETLNVPHVVLTNFPSEKGYLATLGENVNAVLTAAMKK